MHSTEREHTKGLTSVAGMCASHVIARVVFFCRDLRILSVSRSVVRMAGRAFANKRDVTVIEARRASVIFHVINNLKEQKYKIKAENDTRGTNERMNE